MLIGSDDNNFFNSVPFTMCWSLFTYHMVFTIWVIYIRICLDTQCLVPGYNVLCLIIIIIMAHDTPNEFGFVLIVNCSHAAWVGVRLSLSFFIISFEKVKKNVCSFIDLRTIWTKSIKHLLSKTIGQSNLFKFIVRNRSFGRLFDWIYSMLINYINAHRSQNWHKPFWMAIKLVNKSVMNCELHFNRTMFCFDAKNIQTGSNYRWFAIMFVFLLFSSSLMLELAFYQPLLSSWNNSLPAYEYFILWSKNNSNSCKTMRQFIGMVWHLSFSVAVIMIKNDEECIKKAEKAIIITW